MTASRHANVPEPTAFERAASQFGRPAQSCSHCDLDDAIARGRLALSILETEQQFREARKGMA